MLLADELFCIGHQDRSGRTRLHPRAGGIGLAAALLAELELSGRIDIRDGAIRVIRHDAPADALAHTTLAQLLAEPHHTDLRTWLAFLAGGSTAAVAQRLIRGGVLKAVERRRFLGTRVVYVPVDANRAVWPEVRLARLLATGGRLTEVDAVLASLVAVTGLARHVLWDPVTHDAGYAHLVSAMTGLHPPLAELVAATETAVGEAVLSPR